MSFGALIATIVIPALTALYTWNYARWAWRHKLKRGALGLAVLALGTIALPAYLLFFQR